MEGLMQSRLEFDQLSPTERVIVRAARARPCDASCCAEARPGWDEIEAALQADPGRAAGRVAAWGLKAALGALGGRLRSARPDAEGVAIDEARLLAAVALLQAGRHAEAEQVLRWVAPVAAIRKLVVTRLGEVARALLAGSEALPLRWGVAPT